MAGVMYICEICGSRLNEHHCKARCPNCGRMLDCSDLPILPANRADDDTHAPAFAHLSEFKAEAPASAPAKSAAHLPEAGEHPVLDGDTLAEMAIPAHALALLPAHRAREHGVLPLAFVDDTVTLALSDWRALLSVGPLLKGAQVEPLLATPDAIARGIERHY